MYLRTLLLCLVLSLCTTLCEGQSSWEQLSDHPSSGLERAFSFEIDGTVYVGGGRVVSGNNSSIVQAYDVATDTWTRKANFPGPSRRNAFAFEVGGFGYMGTGYDGAAHLDDFWKYSPEDDTWTQLPDFPGGVRSHVLGIGGDSTGYVLTGGRSGDNTFKKDMWAFDPAAETWTQLDNFPGASRWRTFGWIIDQKLYAGGGARFPGNSYRDVYVYDLVSGTWNENPRASCPSRKGSAGFFFALQGKGYYGEGTRGPDTGIGNLGTKVFVYDPVLNSWAEEIDFIGPERMLGFSEVSGEKAILGLGRDYEREIDYDDVYAFTPGTTSSVTFEEEGNIDVFPNPVSDTKLSIQGEFIGRGALTVSVFDIKGALQGVIVDRNTVRPDLIELDVDHLIAGIYQVEIMQGNRRVALRFVKQ